MVQGVPHTESCLLGRGQGLQRSAGGAQSKPDQALDPGPETRCAVSCGLQGMPGNVWDQIAQRQQFPMGQPMATRLLKVTL